MRRTRSFPGRAAMIGAAAAILAAAALGVGGDLAQAQIAPGGGPIAWGADHSEFSDPERLLRLVGRAELIQDPNRLRANAIDIHLAPAAGSAPQGGFGASSGDIERIVAEGDVYFVTPTQVVRGDRAVYTTANDTIVVTGEVIMTQGENVVTGSQLSVQVSAGTATMQGSPTEHGRRVRGVFYPEE